MRYIVIVKISDDIQWAGSYNDGSRAVEKANAFIKDSHDLVDPFLKQDIKYVADHGPLNWTHENYSVILMVDEGD